MPVHPLSKFYLAWLINYSNILYKKKSQILPYILNEKNER